MVVSPGPADLSLSALTCADSDGGLLLPGDDVRCAVAVRPRAGYEDVQGATAAVQIPNQSQWSSGGDSHDATWILFDTPSLGDVSAGETKSAAFHLKIKDGTAAGTQMRPAGTLNATSVPLGGPMQQAITGPTLIVGQVIVPPGETPVITTLVDAAPTPATPQIVAANTSYKLRANTIHIKLRRGHRRRNHLWRGSHRRSVFVQEVRRADAQEVRERSGPRRPRVPEKKASGRPSAGDGYDQRDAPDLHREAG